MKVWIVEQGCYEDKYFAGVYATAEAAIAAHPIPSPLTYKPLREGGWQTEGEDSESWWNGLDWGEHCVVFPAEVEGLNDESAPDAKV